MTDIIPFLLEKIERHHNLIDDWFAQKFLHTPPFFYSSVDIRHSGAKLAPVDTNVFPAGFNNLTPNGKEKSVHYANEWFNRYYPTVEKILLVPENHTRNKFYLENIASLLSILNETGKEVMIGSLSDEITETTVLESHSGLPITLHPIERNAQNQLQTNTGFVADIILTNNDFTNGAPDIIRNIDQTVVPPVGMGWYQRRKTSHFATYNELIREFCQLIEIDPWLISTVFYKCGVINFKEKTGIECVARGVEKTIYRIKEKYEQYGIKDQPYVFIKSNQGTYGMGIMTATSADDVITMSKKIRNKMNTIKGGTSNTEVIIQEGVPTIDQVNEYPAEHMMYLVAGKTVGCIYRVNDQKDAFGNLNATGMHFITNERDSTPCKVVSTVARLASYAAAWECYDQTFDI